MNFSPVSETRVVASLALLYAFRMLGLFMVLPVLMLYGGDYRGATPETLGLALGIYGLTQACFQIPLGFLSDIWGRKPVIVLGLVVFGLGGVVAAQAETVQQLVVGRALQGAGAIASAVMALVSDLTSEQNRTKAMAAIGASIGVSFSLALVLGPLLAGFGGMSAIFWVSAGLAGIGLLVLWRLVPRPVAAERAGRRDSRPVPRLLLDTLRQADLLRLDLGIFCLHFVLMACFVAVPGILASYGFHRASHWQVYLPVMALAFVVMLPFIIIAERRRQVKRVFVGAVALLAAALLALMRWHSQVAVGLGLLFAFFVAFNLLEATLPSLVSKLSPAGSKGTAMGIYSTSQFLGAFGGGVAGGLVLGQWGPSGVFGVCGILAVMWAVIASYMRAPRHLTSLRLTAARGGEEVARQALALPGVAEALWVEEEKLLYLKVDHDQLDYDELLRLTGLSPAPAQA